MKWDHPTQLIKKIGVSNQTPISLSNCNVEQNEVIQCTPQIIPGFANSVYADKVYVNKAEWELMDNWTRRHL